jgi:hypothetical protein
MPPATVTLPRGRAPRFPRRCVACGRDNPAGSARIVARDGLWGAAFWAGWFSVVVPCCPRCARPLQAWRLARAALTLLIAGAAFAFGVVVLLPGWPGWAAGLAVLALCTLGFLGQFAWGMARPPPFSLDPHDRHVEYEFRDTALAEQFARLNGALPRTD